MWDRDPKVAGPLPVLFPSGACALVHAGKLRSLGGLDPLYSPATEEDVDLGYAALKRGWQIIFEPSVRVLHEEGATMKQLLRGRKRAIRSTRNRYLFTWKNVTDRRCLGRHLVWLLPRAVYRALFLRDPWALVGAAAALARLPAVRRSRRRERPHRRRTDAEVASLFEPLARAIEAGRPAGEANLRQ
jgi:GT2 family glycosyltransferase